ncbi:MAG: hypothetical protein V4726_24235 [Verrucomicrobiota bacterium]
MTTSTCQRIRATVAALLILGPIVCLGFMILFAWGWTNNTNWGAWSKGPQTQSEHFYEFFPFLLRLYWLQILASAAAVATGAYLWPRRLLHR